MDVVLGKFVVLGDCYGVVVGDVVELEEECVGVTVGGVCFVERIVLVK